MGLDARLSTFRAAARTVGGRAAASRILVPGRRREGAHMLARVAVWEPMPTDDRSWVIDAAASVPGVEAYHLIDPESGNGLSIAFFRDEQAMTAAGAAIRRRGEEIGWHEQPRPQPISSTIYKVMRNG
jgi:hypothetical protein